MELISYQTSPRVWPVLWNNNFKKLFLWNHWLDFIIIFWEMILRWHSLRFDKNVMKTWKTWPPGGVARFIQCNFENFPLKTSYKSNISRNFFLWSLISPMTSGERLRAAWPSCIYYSPFGLCEKVWFNPFPLKRTSWRLCKFTCWSYCAQ